MASISFSEATNDKEGKEAREFASAVLTGTAIGRSLQDALQSLAQQDAEEPENDSDSDDSATKPPIHEIRTKPLVTMTESCQESILQSFRTRVAQTNRQDSAPLGLLQGKCDFHNRYGQNWMISLDQVKLKERPQKFSKRKRENRPSLWDRDMDNPKRHNGKQTKEVILKKKVQLLAYGDVA